MDSQTCPARNLTLQEPTSKITRHLEILRLPFSFLPVARSFSASIISIPQHSFRSESRPLWIPGAVFGTFFAGVALIAGNENDPAYPGAPALAHVGDCDLSVGSYSFT